MGDRVLVTGAGGFIGSHVIELLVRSGHDVRAFVQYNSSGSWGWLDTSEVADELDVFSGDIRDPIGVRTAMNGCDSVLHLAALIGIPYSYQSPYSYLETNVKGTLNVVQAARDLGVGHVIHTSTSEVYGTAQFVPITEEHPLQGQSPYSASKIGADQIAFSYHASFGLPVTILRPFNTYGPRQSTRAVIPTVITQIADGSKCLRLGALHPTRDFNFVSDTARRSCQHSTQAAVSGRWRTWAATSRYRSATWSRSSLTSWGSALRWKPMTNASGPKGARLSACGPQTRRHVDCLAGSQPTAAVTASAAGSGRRLLGSPIRRTESVTDPTVTLSDTGIHGIVRIVAVPRRSGTPGSGGRCAVESSVEKRASCAHH